MSLSQNIMYASESVTLTDATTGAVIRVQANSILAVYTRGGGSTVIWWDGKKQKMAATESRATVSTQAGNTVQVTPQSGNTGAFNMSIGAIQEIVTDGSTGSIIKWYSGGVGFDSLYVTESPSALQTAINAASPSGNFVTTNTAQSGLTGTKSWDDAHTFNAGIHTDTISNETANGDLTLSLDAATGAGQAGGTVTLSSNAGVANVGALAGGAGGEFVAESGAGGGAATGVAGNGGTATVTTGDGGDSTGVAGTGGNGGTVVVQTGAGGEDTDGTAGVGGDGGEIQVTAGAGGDGLTAGAGGGIVVTTGAGGESTTGAGGEGGTIVAVASAGGDTSGIGGAGGAGGSVEVSAGNGGNDLDATAGTGGAGGHVILTPGEGGSGNTVGAEGELRFRDYTGTIQAYVNSSGFVGVSALQNEANTIGVAPNTTMIPYGDGKNAVFVIDFSGLQIGAGIPGAANLALGVLIGTLPAGFQVVEVTRMDVALNGDAPIQADTPDVGIGSELANGAVAVLGGTATFEDYITGQTAADVNGTVTRAMTLPTAGSSMLLDSLATKTVFLNVAAAWSGISPVLTATGSVTLKVTIMD